MHEIHYTALACSTLCTGCLNKAGVGEIKQTPGLWSYLLWGSIERGGLAGGVGWKGHTGHLPSLCLQLKGKSSSNFSSFQHPLKPVSLIRVSYPSPQKRYVNPSVPQILTETENEVSLLFVDFRYKVWKAGFVLLLRSTLLCVSGIENLPCELQRNFQLMRELDQRTEGRSRLFSPACGGPWQLGEVTLLPQGPRAVGLQPSLQLWALAYVLWMVLTL